MAKKKRKTYSDLERIIRVWDIEKVKDLMSRRTLMDANGEHDKELAQLWVSDPEYKKTASFGKNWGYYVGMDEIERYYVAQYNERRSAQLAAISAADPSVENIPENLGYGSFSIQPLSTPHIILADDGKTAQGTWYSIGQESYGLPGGEADAKWHCQKICADLVKEADGSWKIWHLFISSDFMIGAGHDTSELRSIYIRGTSHDEKSFGKPTVSMLAHDPTYTWCDNYPPLGDTYETWSEDISYGPEGHPKYED